MADKKNSNSLADKINEFVGAIIFAIIVIAIVLSILYWVIKEYVIPALIVLFLIIVGLVLIIVLARVFGQLIAYLTLKKRYSRKIAAFREKISQLNEYDSAAGQRIPDWHAERRLSAGLKLSEVNTERNKKNAEMENAAIVLADHLSDKLDGLNKSRNRISRKINKRTSDRLSQKLEKKDKKASLLETEIEQLKTEYSIEPDPAYLRKQRKYPIISKFDKFVASLFDRE